MKKVIVIIIGLSCAVFIALRVYQNIGGEQENGPRPRGAVTIPVEAAAIEKTTISDVQLFTGTLMPKSHFVVAPKVGGRVEKLIVNIGDVVKRDQLIAMLEDDEYAQQVEQARAELSVSKANLEEQQSALEAAQKEFERIKALHNKKIASDSELDSRQLELRAQAAKIKVAMAQVEQREAALQAAKVRLSYAEIRASWQDGDGSRVVGERFVDEGAMLSSNSPIVSIYDISTLTAVIFVIERDYPKVKIGQAATVTLDAYPHRSFQGKIVRVAPVLRNTTRQARVEVEIPNDDWLIKPGMFARVHIEFAKRIDATVVPVASLAKRNNQQGVFLLSPDKTNVQFVPVTLGIVSKDMAEVIEPSLSGMVVTLGNHLLEDGSAVSLQNRQHDSPEQTFSESAQRGER
ncbi:MAG: efflux RND transporter periplasmic adaptor subunit [bacterium]